MRASKRFQTGQLKIMAVVLELDDILTPEESALVTKAEREMREGKLVTLAQLRRDLDRPRPRRRH
jgi:hypothetical protein